MRHPVIVVVAALTFSAAAHAQSSDLLVDESVQAEANPDTDVSFSITLTNLGPDAAQSVTLEDALPQDMTFVSLSADQAWNCSSPSVGTNGTITCMLAQLDALQTALFTVVGHIPPGATAGAFFTNKVTASTATDDPTSENDAAPATVQTPPPPAADVLVTADGPSATNPDHDVTYSIAVSNGGPGDATNFVLSFAPPGDSAFVATTQESGPPFSLDNSSGTITWSRATFGSDVTAAFTLVVHIPSSTGDGTHYQFFADISSDYDPNTENNEANTWLCVQADNCAAGGCNANQAVVCESPDQCHDQASCNPVSGACVPVPKADGAACDDADACTRTDTCQSGVCKGADPVLCSAAECQAPGTCNPFNGVCAASTPLADGSACDDGDGCTLGDHCGSGRCLSSAPVVCPTAGVCQTQGACDSSTGECTQNETASDDTLCDDGDKCTTADRCASGVCSGDAVKCTEAGACEEQGECNHATGKCTPNARVADGSGCDDGDVCTEFDACRAGVCTGTPSLRCSDAGASTDGRLDAGKSGTGGSDAGIEDAGSTRAQRADAGTSKNGKADAAVTDAAASDASADAGPASKKDSGCSCRIGPSAQAYSASTPLLFMLLIAALSARQKRRRRLLRR